MKIHNYSHLFTFSHISSHLFTFPHIFSYSRNCIFSVNFETILVSIIGHFIHKMKIRSQKIEKASEKTNFSFSAIHIYSHFLTFPHIYSHFLTFPHIYSHFLTFPHIYWCPYYILHNYLLNNNWRTKFRLFFSFFLLLNR